MNRKGYCPDCGCRVLDPFPSDHNFFALCVDCGHKLRRKQEQKVADHIDGYDRDDLGESLDY